MERVLIYDSVICLFNLIGCSDSAVVALNYTFTLRRSIVYICIRRRFVVCKYFYSTFDDVSLLSISNLTLYFYSKTFVLCIFLFDDDLLLYRF